MYYGDYNRFDPRQEEPIETNDFRVEEIPPEEPKKKHTGLKIAALCLVCALLGAAAGGAGALWTSRQGGGAMRFFGAPAGESTGTNDTQEPVQGGQSAEPTATAPAGNLSGGNSIPAVTGRKELSPKEIYAANIGAAVGITTEIKTTNIYGMQVPSAASGSGFVIRSDGYIVTNHHVIEDAETIEVAFEDGTGYEAKLVGSDEDNDIAVLKIEAAGLTCVKLGSSDELEVGDQVFAIGNPLGELTYSFTGGYVSALDRNVTLSDGSRMNYIQTDTAINSGNSGGPLFNSRGEVVGIVAAKVSSDGSYNSASVEGLGFAIPIDDVKGMLEDIIRVGYVTGKPYMGIINSSVSTSAQRYGTPAGAYVMGVVEGSCAQSAGLQVGDIITGIDDKTVASSDDLSNALYDYKAGESAELTVSRSGETVKLTITFDEKTDERVNATRELQKQIEEEERSQYGDGRGGNYGGGYDDFGGMWDDFFGDWGFPFGW